jgi:conjugative transfer signal peptidase TraF
MTRRAYLLTGGLAALIVGATLTVDLPTALIWNASASAPIGLYLIRPASTLVVSDLVAVTPPMELARFLDTRSYLPTGVPLVKRIAALPGQQVCRQGASITVDGAVLATARAHDRLGRALPSWQGCRRLAAGDVFLLNRHPDSLDGRYFGPLPAHSIVGQAVPLLTDADGDGRYEWHAPCR